MKLTTTPLWVAVFVVGANVHSSLGQWVEWPVAEGGNGHWYRLTDVVGQWIDAEAEAASIGAHLLTINNAAENQWVFDTFAQPGNIWIGLYQDVDDPDYAEPGGGWKWVSGEIVTYTNWVSGEPNDNGGEQWAEMKGAQSIWDGQWNDQIANVNPPMRGMIEITDCNRNGVSDVQDIAHNCCQIGHGAGCSYDPIEACVCAADRYCCLIEWDQVCVDRVTSGECGPCDIDCNSNAVPEECDIADGTSQDCQLDRIPDECQTADNDCDTNGVPDECQPDLDADGLIDPCDPDIDDDGVPNDLDECDNTPLGTAVDPAGRPLGDIDRDCDTDMADYMLFQQGFTGPLT